MGSLRGLLCYRGAGRGGQLFRRGEEAGRFLITMADQANRVPHCDQRIELFKIGLGHADAAMRSGLADGSGFIGAMDTVAGLAESHPARSYRVLRPWRYGFSIVVIGGIR